MMGQYTGPYDRKDNSCVTHVAEVLKAGGVDMPREPKNRFRKILDMIKGKK
jgi:hypothetical protein